MIANEAADAVRVGSRDRFVHAIRLAARSLFRLGIGAGAPIVPKGFDVLEDIAASNDAAFCVSGAGGGDVAAYVGSSPPSEAFAVRARGLGLFEIDVALDEKGVRVATPPSAFTAGVAGTASTT